MIRELVRRQEQRDVMNSDNDWHFDSSKPLHIVFVKQEFLLALFRLKIIFSSQSN